MKKGKKKSVFQKRPYVITGANLADGVCNYSYRITEDTGIGDTHNVKGVGIHEDDLAKAFAKLNAHMAAIDDVFAHAARRIGNINKMHNDELTALYNVTGFKIKGDENESIILIATKQIICSGERMQIQTPKIPIDSLSSYKWWEELQEVSDLVREEVALYKEGKCTNPEPIEEDSNQLTIGDALEDEEEFEKAKM